MDQTLGQPISLDVLKIDSPCPLPLNALPRSDAICFCKTCNKSVHNLAKLTTAQAQEVIASAPKEVCIRMARDAKGRVMTLDYASPTGTRPWRWIPVAASVSLIAAGLQFVFGSSHARTSTTVGMICPRPVVYSPPSTAPCQVAGESASDDTSSSDQ